MKALSTVLLQKATKISSQLIGNTQPRCRIHAAKSAAEPSAAEPSAAAAAGPAAESPPSRPMLTASGRGSTSSGATLELGFEAALSYSGICMVAPWCFSLVILTFETRAFVNSLLRFTSGRTIDYQIWM